MASVKVKFRPSATDGKEGSIYYQVIHDRTVRQIKTDCRVFESEWNSKTSAVAVPVLASIERKNYLQSVASRIEWDVKRLTAIIALLEEGNKSYTVDDILVKFNRQADGQSLFPLFEFFLFFGNIIFKQILTQSVSSVIILFPLFKKYSFSGNKHLKSEIRGA